MNPALCAILLAAAMPAAANDAYLVTATLLVPAKGEPCVLFFRQCFVLSVR